MSEKFILIKHFNAISSTIRKIFHTTQRLKFTAFEVSQHYIILGVNSGGIYIFSRESCEFIKLIPNAHGAPKVLMVSQNEQYLAVAVSTGIIVVFENCFVNSEFYQQVFRDHENSDVTAMKWHQENLFCGDSTGKKKTIFQISTACLMQLDSRIIQLDTHSHFLLVSTQTRTWLSDTETETYKQIGKKSRIGDLGGCFLSTEDEYDGNIYCARPKARLWKANLQGEVVLTLDFRSSLKEKCNDLIYWDNDADSHLNLLSAENNAHRDDFSFGILYQLNKFILTFNENEIKIFDPFSSTLIYSTNLVSNIISIKIINNFIYVWHGDTEFTVLSLMTVQEIVMASLLKRQYSFCADLCMKFTDDIIDVIKTSPKLHYLTILESKIKDEKIVEKLRVIFKCLNTYNKSLKLEKLNKSVVTIHPPPIMQPKMEKEQIEDLSLSILIEQYKINKLHPSIKTNSFNNLMKTSTNNEIYAMMKKFHKEKGDECLRWSAEIILKNLNLQEEYDSDTFQYACEAFFHLNENLNYSCTCKFPLPQSHKEKPSFLKIGYELMQKASTKDNFKEKITYMQKFCFKNADIVANIPIMVQFSDLTVFEDLSHNMTYDMWDETVKLLLKLKKGYCLNCNKLLDVSDSIHLTSLGMVMVRSIKPMNTIKLFKTYSYKFPSGELDSSFYQYCIFMAVSNIDDCILNRVVSDDRVKSQMDTAIGKYLRRKYLQKDCDSQTVVNLKKNCDNCSLPLSTPIIQAFKRLSCGHVYHEICATFNANNCQICSSELKHLSE